MSMREEVIEESIRLVVEEQALEKFGIPYCELPQETQAWLRSLVIEQFYGKDGPAAVTPETGEEE